MGNGFPVEKMKGKVAVVSGGIGIAPLLLAVKHLSGCEVTLCCGFRDQSYALDDFRPYVRKSAWQPTAEKRDTRDLLPT